MGLMKKWQREQNLKDAQQDFIDLQDAGHDIMTYTDYHWRIDGIDVWPSSKKYMINGVVRHYNEIKDIFKPIIKGKETT